MVIKGTIHVERDSQKKIVIGKGGQKLKKIGEIGPERDRGLPGEEGLSGIVGQRRKKIGPRTPGPWMIWDIPPGDRVLAMQDAWEHLQMDTFDWLSSPAFRRVEDFHIAAQVSRP